MAKRKRRRFTPEFKAEVVLEALRGESLQTTYSIDGVRPWGELPEDAKNKEVNNEI